MNFKIYKDSWNKLEGDLKKCISNYGKPVKYAGIYALAGDYLILKIDGRKCRFNEKTFEFVQWV